jgi:hypothetical protein
MDGTFPAFSRSFVILKISLILKNLRPYVPYDEVRGSNQSDEREGGYCIHNTNLFATW